MRVHILALLANFIVAFKMQAYVRLDANFFLPRLRYTIGTSQSPNLRICVKQLEPSLDILSEPKVVPILDVQHR